MVSQNKMNDTVAIIIPTYNRIDFLERAINSVYNCEFDEIIVINDNSNVDYSKILDKFILNYPRICYLKHNINKGVSIAKNTGIDICKSHWITCLDDDDIFIGNINNLKCFLNHNSSADIVHFKIKTLVNGEIGTWGKTSVNLEKLKEENIIPNGSIFKKAVWEKLNGFKNIPFEDWDFWIRALQNKSNFVFYSDFMYLREIRYNNSSLLFRDEKKISYDDWKQKYVK
jgi:glycosyltransferase involved in cell wall biosynthesis